MSSFTPKSKGTYVVEVTQNGSDLEGSPFKVQVGDHEVCSPAKVKVSGDGLKSAKANTWNNMEVDISNAGTSVNVMFGETINNSMHPSTCITLVYDSKCNKNKNSGIQQ